MGIVTVFMNVLAYFVKPSKALTRSLGHDPNIDKLPLWIKIVASRLGPLLVILILSLMTTDPDVQAQLEAMACEMQIMTCGAVNHEPLD
jgi:hypothetical protein